MRFVVIFARVKLVIPSGYDTFILCNNLHHFPQSSDTVHFSNEAYSGTNNSMSFDNVLYDNVEADPVLMQPLDFPIDDKQPLPQVNTNQPNFKGTVKQLWRERRNELFRNFPRPLRHLKCFIRIKHSLFLASLSSVFNMSLWLGRLCKHFPRLRH